MKIPSSVDIINIYKGYRVRKPEESDGVGLGV